MADASNLNEWLRQLREAAGEPPAASAPSAPPASSSAAPVALARRPGQSGQSGQPGQSGRPGGMAGSAGGSGHAAPAAGRQAQRPQSASMWEELFGLPAGTLDAEPAGRSSDGAEADEYAWEADDDDIAPPPTMPVRRTAAPAPSPVEAERPRLRPRPAAAPAQSTQSAQSAHGAAAARPPVMAADAQPPPVSRALPSARAAYGASAGPPRAPLRVRGPELARLWRGDPAELRRAIVAAEILGPCLAIRP